MHTDSSPARPAGGRDAQGRGSGLVPGFAASAAAAVFLLRLGAVGPAFPAYLLVALNHYHHRAEKS